MTNDRNDEFGVRPCTVSEQRMPHPGEAQEA